MKRIVLPLVLVGLVTAGLAAAELQTADGATITVKTRTQFDLSVDDPTRWGLATSIPELSLNFSLSPWQKLGDKPRSVQPQGFIQFELDKIELRYTNGAVKDYNGGNPLFGFQFNDPGKFPPGYFGPVYMPNMRAGIVWGDWTLQTAAAGVQNFWNPWNRDYDHSYQQMAADWAYLDTRAQYRRGAIADYLADRTNETNYWSYDSPALYFDDLSTDDTAASGALLGLEYAGKQLGARLKLNTRYRLADLPAGESNGVGLGTDVTFTPVQGLTSTTSVVLRTNYIDTASPDRLGAGTKLAYDFPIPGLKGLSLAPMVGYDFRQGLSKSTKQAQEASTAVTLHWAGTEGWAYDMLHDRTGTVFSGATLAYKLAQLDLASTELTHSMLFTLYETQGDTGLVKGLGAEVEIERAVTGVKSVTQLSAYGDYTQKLPKGSIQPWTRILMDWETRDLVTEFGVKVEGIVPKSSFGLRWLSNNWNGNAAGTRLGTATAYVDITL